MQKNSFVRNSRLDERMVLNMKKLLIVLLLICTAATVIFLIKSRNGIENLSAIFDPTPPEVSGKALNGENSQAAQSSKTQTPEASDKNIEQTSSETQTPSGQENTSDEKEDNVPDDSAEKNEAPFSHSEAEKQTIINRYIEAQDFYYSMLYQQFDLDSYDVIVRKNADGYDTEYHRVLYYNVNSKADLTARYREYFTEAFVGSVDFSSYIEENEKLYCAETRSNVSGNTAHGHTVESIDENNAYIIAAGTSQKIKAVKSDGKWYFASVAIK